MILRLLIWLVSFGFLSQPCSALTPEDIPIHAYPANKTKNREGKVAICCIFKNEAVYLREWIEFHREVGVSHFYLYNNCSIDHYLAVLQPYINSGVVELFDVPFDSSVIKDGAKTHNFVQICCYNHALKIAKKANRWLAIIDSDEFIVPVAKDNIYSILKNYDYAGGLIVYWQLYGTSNVWELGPTDLLIERLLKKFPENYGENWLFKTIVQTEFADVCRNPHTCKYIDDHHAFTTEHKRFTHHPRFLSPPVDLIRINHYTYRTESFYQNIKKPRRQDWGYNPSPEEEKAKMDLSNSTLDPIMLRFVPKVRKRIFGT